MDNIREAVEQAGPNDQSYTNFGLFLSHIAVSDDKVNKPNTVMKLPEGVEVIFADSSGQQTTFAEAMNEMMAKLEYNEDEWKVLNPQQKLKFKFIVKKDGQIIKSDENWREITLHVYNTLDAVKNLVKTTLENTENNFAEGIVDNIDFSDLPEVMKNEAVEMEKKYPNVDGSTPQDGALPQFSNPTNKRYDWVNKDEETSNGNHATSPARYFPYDMDLFQGDGDDITKALQGYIPYITDYKPGNSGETAEIEPSVHDKELIDYYSLGPIFTKTMFTHNFTPELGGVNESYWNSLVQDIPIPQLDFEPKVNLDIVTLAPSTPPSESKGNVVVKHYKEGTTDEVKDGRTTAEQVVGENYDVSGDKVTGRFTGKDGKTYEYVSTQGNPTDTIKEGTTEVIYYYKEVPSESKGNVVVKHYKEGTTDEVKDGRTTAEQVVGENYDVSGDKVTGRFTGKDGKTYEYVSTQGNPTDTIKEGTTEVIYYYKEVPSESKGNVVVKHYKEGTTDEVKDGRTTDEQVVGENYDVSGDKVTGRFTGKDGKTYEYVSTQGNPTDTIKEGTTEVIYYYKEVPSESKGNVVVKHYKEGTTDEVKDGRTTDEQVVGENYDVSGDKVTGRFTGKDGKTYEYVSTQGNPTDTIKEGTTEVIYYYREVPTPPPSESKGNVVVKHYKEGTTDEVKDGRTTDEQVVGENYDVSGDKVTGRFTGKDGK
ncbi:MucBP domain-containing protein, partial [Streptococcus suis]|nr:MucBP domain-containing protein [Streptococcus suis]